MSFNSTSRAVRDGGKRSRRGAWIETLVVLKKSDTTRSKAKSKHHFKVDVEGREYCKILLR